MPASCACRLKWTCLQAPSCHRAAPLAGCGRPDPPAPAPTPTPALIPSQPLSTRRPRPQVISQVRFSELEVPTDAQILLHTLRQERKQRTADPKVPSTSAADVAGIAGGWGGREGRVGRFD